MKIDYPRRGKRGVRRFLPSWRQWLLLALGFFVALFAAAGIAYAAVDVPQPTAESQAQTTIVTFADGKVMGRFGEVNRQLVDLDRIPQQLRDAVIAAEDRSFYTNKGVSPTGIARSAYKNLTSDQLQGGSTITQQYVKNTYLSHERTLSRKLKEVLVAVKVDREMSKDEILRDYLNTIYWGRGAYGVATASLAYFGKPVADLSLSESAYLAAIIQAPARYDAKGHPEVATARWNYVLDGMVADGDLSPAERAAQKFPAIKDYRPLNRLGGPNGYILESVRKELLKLGFTQDEIDFGGMRVRTTIDRQAQKSAVDAVKQKFYDQVSDTKDVHVGLAAIDPASGAVRAMYGGADFVTRPGINDATIDNAQVGSTFKPFTVAAALEERIGLRSRFDGNSGIRIPGTKTRINNEFDQNYGRVDLVRATEDSINTAFVDLTLEIGADKVKEAAVRAGIPANTRGLDATASITLGVANISPMNMAFAYSTFAAQGMRSEGPYLVQEVRGNNKGLLYKATPKLTRVFDADVTADTTYAMESVVRNGTGTAARALDRPAAGKTGTAALRPDTTTSSWFAGYTPQLSAAVGFYKGNGTADLDGVGGLSTFFGGEYPTRVWTAFMRGALKGQPVEDFPPRANIGRTLHPAPATPRPRPSRTAEPDSTASPSPTPSAPARPTTPATPATPTRPSGPSSPTPGGTAGGPGGSSGPSTSATPSATTVHGAAGSSPPGSARSSAG